MINNRIGLVDEYIGLFVHGWRAVKASGHIMHADE